MLRKTLKITAIMILACLVLGVFPVKGEASTITYRYKLYINGKEVESRTYERPINRINTYYLKNFRLILRDGKLFIEPRDNSVPAPQEDPKPTPQPQPQPQPQPKPQPEPPQEHQYLTPDESRMLNLVNNERVSRGLQPLEIDMELVKLARMKSRDMITKGYFSHYSPTYGSPFNMMKNAGVDYMYAGENIAGAPTVDRAHTALMNSDGHRKNILNPNYTHVGIGIIDGGPYGKMFTQMFVGR